MAKINLNNITSPQNVSVMNANFQKIAVALDEQVLYRDNVVGEPNQMENDLDMNSYRIYNLPVPVAEHEPMRKADAALIVTEFSEDLVEAVADAEEAALQAELSAQEAQEAVNSVVAASNIAQEPNGVNDTAHLQASINDSVNKKLTLRPNSVYLVSSLTGVSGITIDGNGSTIRRIENTVGNDDILSFSNKNKFKLYNLTFDGNKANQTNAATNLTIVSCSEFTVEGCSFINAKAVSGGYGSGIVIVDSLDRTTLTLSRIYKNYIANNDGAGVYINSSWYIDISSNLVKSNGGGISVLNFVFPPTSDVSNYLRIQDNTCNSNTGSGITVNGYVEGGTPSAPIYGYSVPASRSVLITGNTCRQNTLYGIADQAWYSVVSHNLCELNGNPTGGGGILFNAAYSDCSSNTSVDNAHYGIDAGGSAYCTIHSNILFSNGSLLNTPATALNLGACVRVIAHSNNIVINNSSQGCVGIGLPGIDGDGVTPFAQRASSVIIHNNHIDISGTLNHIGIYLLRNPGRTTVTNNLVTGANIANRAYILECTMLDCKDNIDTYYDQFGSVVATTPAGATTILADHIETAYISGTTTITSVQTFTSNTYLGRVRDVLMTNMGSGYSRFDPPTVTFTGGGGSGAAATPEIDNGGRLVGIAITNTGSGYTSAPTVSFVGGTGSGATAIGLVGCNNFDGKELSLMFLNGLTVTDGLNLNLAGNYTAVANSGVLKVRGAFGGWYETSRSTT